MPCAEKARPTRRVLAAGLQTIAQKQKSAACKLAPPLSPQRPQARASH
jgi:hypothetical protein